ncbi:aldose epimerase [Marinicrinis lubricantis]|uniref:Aldose epimerase n=1 Tax=Marinicrinis lubricantis TaxID=2086470 RepID=A0ABW1IP24_9BACL
MSQWSVRTFEDQYAMVELKEEHTASWVQVCPERGGIITSYGVQGKELLYLDKQTFYDPDANIRGGIPILFPISGQLIQGQYEWEGKTYAMKNHGFARNLPWEVVSTSNEGQASVLLRLRSSDITRASFPFEFELQFTYILKDGKLTIDQTYHNRSEQPMPMYPGFHPYFEVDRKAIAYDTDAARYLDYNDELEKTFSGTLDLTGLVESTVFLDASRRHISFQPFANEPEKIHLHYGSEFKYVVLWSVEGKPFVCVEPWMAKTGEFHRREELTWVQPGQTLTTFLSISKE